VRGIDHLRVCGSSVPSKLPEQVFPDAAPRPAHKAVIDRGRRTILGRATAPATAALQDMHDAADDPAIVRPLDALTPDEAAPILHRQQGKGSRSQLR
jgi:transposase InsO family protein